MRITYGKILSACILLSCLCLIVFPGGDRCDAFGNKRYEKQGTPLEKWILVNKVFSAGKEHYRKGEYDEAVTALRAALEIDGDNEEIREYLMLAKYQMNRRYYDNTVSRRTNGGAPEKKIHDLYLLGQYALRSGRDKEAVEYFQEVLRLDPEHQGALTDLAQARAVFAKERKTAGGSSEHIDESYLLREIGSSEEFFLGEEMPDSGELSLLEKEIHRDMLVRNILMDRLRERGLYEETTRSMAPWGAARMRAKPTGMPEHEKILALKEKEKQRLLMAKLIKKRAETKTPEDVQKARSAQKLMEQEKQRRIIAERKRKKELKKRYDRSVEMFKRGHYDEAFEGFQKIAEQNVDFKKTRRYIAAIRKAKVARERDVKPPLYTLGPDDSLEITVANHPEFSGKVTVEQGGEIILPLSKEVINVNGLTKEELAELLTKKLSRYVKSPEVNIVITGYNSKKWYILGEVGVRGEYPMGKTDLTLLEALYQARLPLENSAAMRRVALIKPHRTHPKQKWINVYELLYEGKMKNNVRIEPGDIIYVPKTVVSKFNSVVTQITSPLTSTSGSLTDIQALSDSLKAITPLKYTLTPRERQ